MSLRSDSAAARLTELLLGLSVAAGRLLRFLAYAVLATFEPVMRLVLLLLALAGFTTCVIYRLLLHDPRFPTGTMLVFSVAMCGLSVGYALMTRTLEGRSR